MASAPESYVTVETTAAQFEAARPGGFKLRPPAWAKSGQPLVIRLSDEEAFAAVGEVTDEGGARIDAACPPGDYEPAKPLEDKGFEQIRLSIVARAKGRPRPPGVPPNEAEKRPPIPARVRKPKKD